MRMGSLEKELEEVGNRLLKEPPSSVDELLNLLDKVEHLLSLVQQKPSKSVEDSLAPMMKAIISNELLNHALVDVKVSDLSCVTEITRISAPECPYPDELMKEIFKLSVKAFDHLSEESGRCYKKATSILNIVAKVKSCLIMLDLECDDLIVEMFQLFFKIIRSNHPRTVVSDVEKIMTMVIEEREDISWQLLCSLLASVKKENESDFAMSWKLGEKVIKNCTAKLKPYLVEAVKSMGVSLDEYAPFVASICDGSFDTSNPVIDSSKHVVDDREPEKKDSSRLFKQTELDVPSQVVKQLEPGNSSKDNSKKLEHSKSTDGGTDASGSMQVVRIEKDCKTVEKKRRRNPKLLPSSNTISTDEGNRAKQGGLDHMTEVVEGSSSKKRERKSNTLVTAKSKRADAARNEPHISENVAEVTVETEAESISRKRERKPNSLVQPEEGYDSYWIFKQRKPQDDSVLKQPVKSVKEGLSVKETAGEEKRVMEKNDSRKAKHIIKESGNEKLVIKFHVKSSNNDKAPLDESSKANWKSKRTPTKEVASGKELHINEELDEGLVNGKIKVWWPRDKTFYEGVVSSFDPIKKKHKILYDDGDQEVLDLKNETWEMLGVSVSPDGGQGTDFPSTAALPDSQPEMQGKAVWDSTRKCEAGSSSRRCSRTMVYKQRVKGKKSWIHP